jgi:hypothetical protein
VEIGGMKDRPFWSESGQVGEFWSEKQAPGEEVMPGAFADHSNWQTMPGICAGIAIEHVKIAVLEISPEQVGEAGENGRFHRLVRGPVDKIGGLTVADGELILR